MRLGRRELLLGAAALAGCSRAQPAEAGQSPPLGSRNVRVLQWDLGAQSFGAGRASLVVPAWTPPAGGFPVVVALHGRGESLKPPVDGALGWPRDYALVRAFDRLMAPPLRATDYEGFVEPQQLAEANRRLARDPFAGVIVACPWLPDLDPRNPQDVGPYGQFVLDVLLPRVRAETPARTDSDATGIDGVSLGGAFALAIGLQHSESFGAVGGIQPAIMVADAQAWALAAQGARVKQPRLRLRVLTSYDDYFHDGVTEVSRAWQARGIDHDFDVYPGPHDYIFNRGTGSIELLRWQDRALRAT